MLTGEQSRDTCAPNAVLSIDIANVEEMIAVEVDGPFHFVTRVDLRSQKERGEGVGKMKKRKLEHAFSWNGDYQEINGSTYGFESTPFDRVGLARDSCALLGMVCAEERPRCTREVLPRIAQTGTRCRRLVSKRTCGVRRGGPEFSCYTIDDDASH